MILLNRNTLGIQIRNSKIEYCGSIYRNNHNLLSSTGLTKFMPNCGAGCSWFQSSIWIPKLGIPTHISKYFKYSVLTRYILHKYTPEIVQNNSICLVCDVVYFDFLVVESQRLVSDRRGGSHTTSHHQQHRA